MKQSRPGPALTLDERPAGAGKGVDGPVGGAHPSGLYNTQNALDIEEACLSFEMLMRGLGSLWSPKIP